MTGSMYAAVSGLMAHMNKLNVISNNVANVNTYGYKTSRVTFAESIYTTSRTGSNGGTATGGYNPIQYGYGCNIGTIDLDMSTKNYVPTGMSTDCMINGSGFFLVGPKPASNAGVLDETDASSLYLTRVGNFTFDAEGYLTDGNGQVVYGFVTTSGGTDAGKIANMDDPQISTQLVPIRLPQASNVIGSEGVAIYPGINQDGKNVYISSDTDGSTISATTESISIDGKTGKITCTNSADNSVIVVGYIPLAQLSNPNGASHVQGSYYKAGESAGACDVVSIAGALDGKYLNNQTQGTAILSSGSTTLVTGGLESSGTDISNEFTEMITTQRGYQANSRIITVTDSMLEELVNMKR